MKSKIELKVADFFSGAGGWSEGFRLAGFEIVFSLDNWKVAKETHKLNHPKTIHPDDGDILQIDIMDLDTKGFVPDTEVIVGSPPCISFSHSNKAGNGNKDLGIKLIEKFFQIVAIKKHKHNSILKYWLMENVPNSRKYVKNSYSFKDLGINKEILDFYSINKSVDDIALEFSTSKDNIFNSADYGVPQRRERYITGEFPIPNRTHDVENWVSLGHVIESLSNFKSKEFTDPNYPLLNIPNNELTDHFYDTSIHKFEWEHARLVKQQGRYYGKMSFPENLTKPSRTIMATRSARSRESLILPGEKKNEYRLPTIREIASIMSFPISYQFAGKDELSKYRLIGNAVPVKLSYCFAMEILKELGISNKDLKFPKRHQFLEVNLRLNSPKKKKPLGRLKNANFAFIVPDLKFNNVRIELDNNFPKNTKVVKWRASIHHATGKLSMKDAFPKKHEVEKILKRYSDQEKLQTFRKKIKQVYEHKIPDAQKFQEQFCSVNPDPRFFTPFETLDTLSKLIIEEFLSSEFNKDTLSNLDYEGKEIIKLNKDRFPRNEISLIHLIALDSLIYICGLTKK